MKRKTKQAAVHEEEPVVAEEIPKKKSKKDKQIIDTDLNEDAAALEEREPKKEKSKKKKAVAQDSETAEDDPSKKQIPPRESLVENGTKLQKDRKGKEAIDAHNNLRLFIKNIPLSIDEATLRSDFEVCGKVANFKLLLDSNGHSRGLAFVTYSDESGCVAAMEFDNSDYGGRKLSITRAEAKQSEPVSVLRSDNEKSDGKTTKSKFDLRVIVKNIPLTVDEELLRRDFEECGTIKNLKLLSDRDGQSRGMAFITFADESGYFAALKYNATDYGGKRLVVKRAESTGGGAPSLGPKPPGCNSLVLTKLAPDVTSDDITDFFKDCGSGPTKVGLLTDNKGRSRCTARVDFQGDALDKAAALAGSLLKGQSFFMEFCVPKTM